MGHFVAVGVLGEQEGVAGPEIARIGHVQIRVELAPSRTVHATAVARAPRVFAIRFHEEVGGGVEAEIVVLKRLSVEGTVAVQPCRSERLFCAKARLESHQPKGLACGDVGGMDLFVVQKRIVNRVQPVGHKNPIGQHCAVGLCVGEFGVVGVPRGFQSSFQFSFFAPRAFVVGLGEPTLVAGVLLVEGVHVVHGRSRGQAAVREFGATQVVVVRASDVSGPFVVPRPKRSLEPCKHVAAF